MSLLVWLPLNGDLTNNGVSKIQLKDNGATIEDNGKLGKKCYYLNGKTLTYHGFTALNDTSEYSACCWVKFTTFPSGSQSYCISVNNAASNSLKFILGVVSSDGTTAKLRINANSKSDVGTLQLNTWYHLAVCISNTTGYMYINGELVKTVTGLSQTASNNLVIGGRSSNAGATSFAGLGGPAYYNDVRIYNHCLTPREVKHLSQGLAWHLKLDNVSNINLLTSMSPGGRTTVTNKYHVNMDLTTQKDTYFYFNVSPALELNKTYTVSFDVSGYPEGLEKWSFYLFKQGNTNYLYYINGNGHHTWTFTTDPAKLPTDQSLTQFIADDGSRPVGTGTVKISNFKVEEGNSDTLWRPHSTDTVLNYDIEYDCSGYKSHANRHGIRGVRDTARYSHSAEFTGGDYLVSDTMNTDGQDELTLSAWVNPSTYTATGSSTDRQTIIIGGAYLTLANGYVSSYCYGKTTSYFTDKTTKIPLNTWSHIAASWYADGVHKLYVNGKMVAQTTQTVAPASGDRHKKKEVGAETNGASRQFQGKISDVRIYTTALSDDDIKELYEVATSYHENGVFETYCLESDKNISNLKYYRNKTQVKDFSEIGYTSGMKVKVLSDGSAWARIHWLDISSNQTVFSGADEVAFCNEINRFSKMGLIDHFLSVDGYYEFMLTYPKLSATGYNRWKQTSSANSSAATGYVEISTTWKTHSGGGLKLSGGSTIYNCGGTNTSYWYAPIGLTALWTKNGITGMPGANGEAQTETELWVRIDNLPKLNKISMLDNESIQAFEIKEN